MNKFFLFILLLLSLICTLACSKQTNIHSIEDYLEAYFPGQPLFHKSFENEVGKFVFYNYQDYYENIQYVALYIILREKPKDNKSRLYNYVHLAAEGWEGDVIKYELIEHDGNDEILYVSETIKNYELVYEFGVVAIKGNTIFQWAVEERDDMVDADRIFGENVKYFKVLK
jgi:hypothetical protein